MPLFFNSAKVTRRLVFGVFVALLSVGSGSRGALADELASVSGVTFDGVRITWEPLEDATGYSVYRNREYLFTVGNVTAYVPPLTGEYQVIAFDDDGNFSPLQRPLAGETVPTNLVEVTSVDTTVPTPQNVLGLVFSKTAGEIYWDRVRSQNLEYRVSLNGVTLGTTDGTSYWVDVLLPNTLNTLSVIALDSFGSTSDAVTLVFDTEQAEFPISAVEADVVVPVDAVLSPQNARLQRYSATTAELFWVRPPISENIEFTEVYREDELLGTSPGISFYDDTRMRDVNYTYMLIAVSTSGARSEPTFVNPGPFDGDSETIVQSLLAGISSAATNNPHVVWGSLIENIGFEDMPDSFVEIDRETSIENGVVRVITVYECGFGTLTAERTSGFVTTADLMFDNCDTPAGGAYGDVSFYSEGGLFSTVEYGEFEILTQDITYVSGKVTNSRARVGDSRRITYEEFAFEIMEDPIDDIDRGVYAEINQTIAYDEEDATGPSTYTVEMDIGAHWTGGRIVTVTTDETFSTMQTGADHYVSGALKAEFDDEYLTLSASTDNPDTWHAELSTRRVGEEFSGEWNEIIQLPCILSTENCR